ncbi:hypothetical protein [Cohnella sp. REN36]|uniref:hypothetical protein n=1 Tax=Cohnella sp. REN36 TaxID=2887347 RepID=UPI001D143C90|nr:hypothetical protein [Cohnella sp. REN36]MCC3376012.1 hypothetical protein [Cohnella sp. REN36]
MKEDTSFYCIECGRLRSYELASIVFQTGYFKVVYPLGSCTECVDLRREMGEADRFAAIVSFDRGKPSSRVRTGDRASWMREAVCYS